MLIVNSSVRALRSADVSTELLPVLCAEKPIYPYKIRVRIKQGILVLIRVFMFSMGPQPVS